MSIEDWLALAWVTGLAGAVAFILIYGRPWRYRDRAVGWHLFWTAGAGGLSYVGLLLAQFSLVPLVITEWVAASIVWWRVGLLLSTRRGISREGKSGHVD